MWPLRPHKYEIATKVALETSQVKDSCKVAALKTSQV